MNALVEQLKSTAAATKATDIRAAFAADSKRFSRFSASLDDLLMELRRKKAVIECAWRRVRNRMEIETRPIERVQVRDHDPRPLVIEPKMLLHFQRDLDAFGW